MEQCSLLNSLGLFSTQISSPLALDVQQQPITPIEKKPDQQLTQEFLEGAIKQLHNLAQLQVGHTPSQALYLNHLKQMLLEHATELEELLLPTFNPHSVMNLKN